MELMVGVKEVEELVWFESWLDLDLNRSRRDSVALAHPLDPSSRVTCKMSEYSGATDLKQAAGQSQAPFD